MNKNKTNFNLDWLLLIILFCCFVVVIITIDSFGASYDEPILYEYASLLPSSYIKAMRNESISNLFTIGDRFVRYYGTAYLLLGEFINQFLSAFTKLGQYQIWHLVNFFTFLCGSAGLYWICKKFCSSKAAFYATILYLSQPLLWGHGVINPKDTPFAAFFILTIAAGIKMVDHYIDNKTSGFQGKSLINFFFRRWYGIVLSGITILVFLDRAFNNLILKPIFTNLINWIIQQPDNSSIKSIVLANTQFFSTQPYIYLEKILHKICFFETLYIIIFLLTLLIVFLKKCSSYQKWLIIAATLLGLTISIRTLGPAAGILVVIYWIIKKPNKQIAFPIIGYVVIACITTYLSWPFLWSAPLSNFFESFVVMANFPWLGTVRFESRDILANELPWYYLPKLIGIQITIPALLLAAIGTFISINQICKDKSKLPLLIPILWFYIPLIGWMILRPNTYDNFRQFLFITPPLFIFTSIAYSNIFPRIHKSQLIRFFGIALTLPGLISGVLLHPYEYIYYNGLVGWTANVEKKYETDYWNTAFCEAGKYLDPQLSISKSVAFTNEGIAEIFDECALNQFQMLSERETVSKIDPDYSVISTRWDDDIDYFRNMSIINTIHIGKTELLVIKSR